MFASIRLWPADVCFLIAALRHPDIRELILTYARRDLREWTPSLVVVKQRFFKFNKVIFVAQAVCKGSDRFRDLEFV
jgi:hypothetical protein